MSYSVYVDGKNKLRITIGKIEGAKLLGRFVSEFQAIKYVQAKGDRKVRPWGLIEYYYKGK